MAIEPIPTPSAPPAAGPYSAAVRAGDWIILAGQVGIDPASGRIADGVEAQARQTLANIRAVLADCGASLDDVAKTTVFVTDIGEFATVNAVYARFMPDPPPARSAPANVALPRGLLISIDAIAVLPSA